MLQNQALYCLHSTNVSLFNNLPCPIAIFDLSASALWTAENSLDLSFEEEKNDSEKILWQIILKYFVIPKGEPAAKDSYSTK